MFDTIKCEVTLPITKKIAKLFRDKKWNEVNFQSKDLDCTLSTYIIKKNKTLVERIHKTKWVKREKEKGLRGFLNRIRKDRWQFNLGYKIIDQGTVHKKLKHTGVINFYSIEPDIHDNEWNIEFDAKFVDGVMTSLKLTRAEIWRTSEEAKKSNDDLRKLLEAHANYLPNKIRRFLNKITFGYWRWFWSKIAFFIRKIGDNTASFILKFF